MSTRFTADDILAAVPEPEPEPLTFAFKITAKALAMFMQTRWIPENNPDYRVKVTGIVTHEDGWSDLIVVGENA